MIDFNPKKAKQTFVERHFLNRPASRHSGVVKLDFDVRRKGTKAKGYYYTLNGEMELRDCARRIDLHFDGNNKSDIEDLMNSKEKLEKLKSACEMGIAVIEAMEAQSK